MPGTLHDGASPDSRPTTRAGASGRNPRAFPTVSIHPTGGIAVTRRARPWTRPLLPAVTATLLLTASACSESPVADPRPSETAGTTGSGPGPTAPSGTAVTIMGAGDIAGDEEEATATARLILEAEPDAVFTTGDNAYPDGSRSDYAKRYDPTWGPFKDRTRPVPGNHEYETGDAAGYVDYFGAGNVTNPADGGLYYAWDVGNGWRAYALNTALDTEGAQLEWLRDDLAAHPGLHYVLYAHEPRYTSGEKHDPFEQLCPLWDTLAATGGLEIVLAGHNHHYERFAPMDCHGRADDGGARSFVVGSGGNGLYGFDDPQEGSEFRNDSDYGVLRLDLYESSYEWRFIASGVGAVDDEPVDTGNAGEILDEGSSGV